MAKIDLSKYGITGTTEIVYNPSYEMLFEEETNPALEGFEKGQESELGAVNVMTGIYTGRSPKDKFIVVDELKFDEIKTKTMKNVLANLKADKALVILNDNDQNVVLSARNIEGVQTALTNTINVFDLLKHNTVVVTKAAVETIEEVYA